MSNQKKVFKIIDRVAIIVAIFVIFSIVYKVTGGNLDISSNTAKKTVKYELQTRNYDIEMLEHIKVGDSITEAKQIYPIKVTEVEIFPNTEEKVIIGMSKAPTIELIGQGYAVVQLEGEVETKLDALMVGKQSISSGNNIFLESRLYKLSSFVTKVEEKDASTD